MPQQILNEAILMDEVESDFGGAERVDLIGRSAPYATVHLHQLVTVNPLDGFQHIVFRLPKGREVHPLICLAIIP